MLYIDQHGIKNAQWSKVTTHLYVMSFNLAEALISFPNMLEYIFDQMLQNFKILKRFKYTY